MRFLTSLLPWRPREPGNDENESADTGVELAPAQYPRASPLHILSDARLRLDNGALRIEREGHPTLERPLEWISSVHVFGHTTLSSAVIAALAAAGAPVVWRAHSGYPVAIMQPMSPPGLAIRRAQLAAAADPMLRLGIARALVSARILSMRGVLRRRMDADKQNVLGRLKHLARRAGSAGDRGQLLGVEGAATALYFSRWSALLRHRAAHLEFPRRSRRPPADPPNAALSYAYAVLAGECACAVAAAGLDPREGFLHEEREGRPALALDLVELFRASVAETAILTAFNTGELAEAHFETANGRCGLVPEGRRIAIGLLERRLEARALAQSERKGLSWRAAVEQEARNLAFALKTGVRWHPAVRA